MENMEYYDRYVTFFPSSPICFRFSQWRYSKISHFTSVSLNRCPQQLLLRKEAGSVSKSLCLQPLIVISAGIKYELIAMVCIKGKKCVPPV